MPYPPSVCPVLHLALGAVPRLVREVQRLRLLPLGLRLETGAGQEIGGSTASFFPTDGCGACHCVESEWKWAAPATSAVPDGEGATVLLRVFPIYGRCLPPELRGDSSGSPLAR
uniref:Uncharacterized protein n=1 Tax=Aegilops tauschii subsp. strangulata TaxID=200361 RepID=A0A453FRS0_AEGTS